MNIWQPMDIAPEDKTVLLLVKQTNSAPFFYGLQDTNPFVTIGIACFDDNKETWAVAGWCWEQDCYLVSANQMDTNYWAGILFTIMTV